MQGGQIPPQIAAALAPRSAAPQTLGGIGQQPTPFLPASFITGGMPQFVPAPSFAPSLQGLPAGALTPRIGPQQPVPLASFPAAAPQVQAQASNMPLFGQGIGSAPALAAPAPAVSAPAAPAVIPNEQRSDYWGPGQ